MADDSSIRSNSTAQNVPISSGRNVPLEEVGHSSSPRKYIKRSNLEDLAIERTSKGITWEDVRDKFSCSKDEAQRKLKHLYSKRVLFTAQDLMDQGLDLPPTFRNRKPQRYYARSKKADIIEEIKKEYKNVLVHPTGVTISNIPDSNTLESDKAQSFLDVLYAFDVAPLYIHKIQLELFINSEGYEDFKQDSVKGNSAKPHEEHIGRAYVKYLIYPNGKVMAYIACSDNPFKIETEADESLLFAFFGQVRDRLLYLLSDVRESIVPSIMNWRLVQCDINKDMEITDKMQITLPDIQLTSADRVFRLYIKSQHDKAVYRCEESLTLKSPLIEAVNKIRNPNQALENKIDNLSEVVKQLSQKVGSILNCKAIVYNDVNN